MSVWDGMTAEQTAVMINAREEAYLVNVQEVRLDCWPEFGGVTAVFSVTTANQVSHVLTLSSKTI